MSSDNRPFTPPVIKTTRTIKDGRMAFRLPPLSSLRFFEAAGRHLSFKLAAAELNVTPSAVSHGIVALERALGAELFLREPRRLALTPEGAEYLPYISQALSLIAIGTERLPGTSSNRTIAVSCAPTFALRWLLPRLPRHGSHWPHVSVTVDTSPRQVAFPVDGFDFAVRMSPECNAGAEWVKLFGETLTPLCSPAYRDTLRNADGSVDLGRATLIHLTRASEDWNSWIERTGTQALDASRGLRFDTAHLAFEAAAMGLGVVMGRRPLVDRDIASGALVDLGLASIDAQAAYWLVSSDGADLRPHLLGFRNWLLQETRAFRSDEAGSSV
jgi:LysR family glycine cleavage system transcriptional activator